MPSLPTTSQARMPGTFAELSGPGFKRAIRQLLHGHRIVYEGEGWLQIRRNRTLVLTRAFPSCSNDNLAHELDRISILIENLRKASVDFGRRLDALQLAIAFVDRLDTNKSLICTVFVDSYGDLSRFDYQVKWPLTPEEVAARAALRERDERAEAVAYNIKSFFGFVVNLSMHLCVGGIAYLCALFSDSGSAFVTVAFAVVAFGAVLTESTVFEVAFFLVLTGLAIFFLTEIPRTEIMGIEIDTTVVSDQVFRAALIGLAVGLPGGWLGRRITERNFA